MNLESNVIRVVNPATLELYATADRTPIDHIPSIVASARAAQKTWATSSIRQREESLERLQTLVCSKSEEIAQVVSNETGKPRIDALNTDVLAGLATLDFSISALKHMFDERKVDLGSLDRSMRLIGRRSYLRPRPLGVVAVVTPWNYPFSISFSQSVMAIAAGNAAIIKPSSFTPFSSMKVAELFGQAGMPAGLVQVVIGPGRESTEALLSAGIDKLIFTGGSETGREVMAECSRTLTPVVLELGGKDPMIVLDDADLGRAADGGAWGAFVNAGQTCAGVKRIIVQEEAFAPFVNELKQRAESLKLGWGWDDPEVSVGPLINQMAVLEMERLVSTFVAGGAELICGGKRPEGLKGHFFQPTILTGVGEEDAAHGKEIFGPLITVSKARDDEEAIRLANGCRYALCASVWTRNIDRGKQIAQRLNGGTAVVNNTPYTYGLAATPWGGSRESGFGRTHGALGFDELLEWHHVHVDQAKTKRDIWWHPYSKERLDIGRDYMRLTFSKDGKGRLDALRRIRNLMNRKQL